METARVADLMTDGDKKYYSVPAAFFCSSCARPRPDQRSPIQTWRTF